MHVLTRDGTGGHSAFHAVRLQRTPGPGGGGAGGFGVGDGGAGGFGVGGVGGGGGGVGGGGGGGGTCWHAPACTAPARLGGVTV